MTTPLRKLPGLRHCRSRRRKAETCQGFIWELAAFDNDLVNTGHVYVVEWDDGSLHHMPLLYFVEPEGNA